jgi:hypothetical protein
MRIPPFSNENSNSEADDVERQKNILGIFFALGFSILTFAFSYQAIISQRRRRRRRRRDDKTDEELSPSPYSSI